MGQAGSAVTTTSVTTAPGTTVIPGCTRTTPEGWLRILPRPEIDGFFIAPFIKPA